MFKPTKFYFQVPILLFKTPTFVDEIKNIIWVIGTTLFVFQATELLISAL